MDLDEASEEASSPAGPPRGAGCLRWLLRLFVAGASLVGLTVLGLGAWLGPWVRDDILLDQIVRAVALDWRDFGREKAEERLQHELDARNIGLQVSDDDCSFSEQADQGKRVRCVWEVALKLPGVPGGLPLVFSSQADLDASGELR